LPAPMPPAMPITGTRFAISNLRLTIGSNPLPQTVAAIVNCQSTTANPAVT
jgi:hypothetical protein